MAEVPIRFNEHLDEEDGPLVFEHACKLGLEGIVSKRRISPYSSRRSPHWIKSKNPNAPGNPNRSTAGTFGLTFPITLLDRAGGTCIAGILFA
jgi:hypothetical protein